MVKNISGITGKKGQSPGAAIGAYVGTANRALKILIAIAAVVALGFLAVWVSSWGVWDNVGIASSEHPIDPPKTVETAINITLGGPIQTWENLVISIVIFLILFFAFSELIQLFTTFSSTTAWIIGFGLALLSGVTKVVANIAQLMGGVAAIGSVGIAIIIITGIASGVILNLGIGGAVRKWRVNRQKDINELKSEQGWGKVTGAVEGLKKADEAASSGEKA